MRAVRTAPVLVLVLALATSHCRAAAPLYGSIDPRLPTGSVAGY
jgi:hypothetical protein